MADTDNKWALNLDKIAYGVAGLVGLIVLCIPLLFSGEDRSGALSYAVEKLEKKVGDQRDQLPAVDPVKLGVIEKDQWTAGAALTLDPDWLTEREQVFVKKLEKDPEQHAIHKPASVTEVSCQRDPAKRIVYLLVKGAPHPENDYVILKKVEILRKAGEGEFAAVGTVPPAPELEFKDEKVVAGTAYSYKIRTTVVADPKVPNVLFDPAHAVQESEAALDASAVPYEFSISSLNIDAQEPKFFAKLLYWDYKAAKPVGGSIKDFKEKDTFADGRYEIFQVPPGEGKVIVKDSVTGAKFTFTTQDSKNPRPVAPWEPITAGGASKEDADAAPEAPAKDAAKAKAAAKPAEKPAVKPADKPAPKKPDTKTKKPDPKKKGGGFTK